MKTRLLIIYHGNCDDGFGAAWAAHRAEVAGRFKTFWPDGVDYVKGIYGVAPPDCAGRDVVIVDFCYSVSEMEQIIREAKSVLVLDHHVSARKMMVEHCTGRSAARWELLETTNHDGGPMTEIVFDNGRMVFDMNRSGAAMAWDHFHGHTHWPTLISYVQDRDLWTKNLQHIDEFTMALRSYSMEFKVWDEIHDLVSDRVGGDGPSGFARFVSAGAAILRYQRQLVDQAVKASFWVSLDMSEVWVDLGGLGIPVDTYVAGVPAAGLRKFKDLSPGEMSAFQNKLDPTGHLAGLKVRAANCIPALASEVGEALAEKYGCVGLTWIEGKDQVFYSLRSRGENATDVSILAKFFGGGGHAKAAGFKAPKAVHHKDEA